MKWQWSKWHTQGWKAIKWQYTHGDEVAMTQVAHAMRKRHSRQRRTQGWTGSHTVARATAHAWCFSGHAWYSLATDVRLLVSVRSSQASDVYTHNPASHIQGRQEQHILTQNLPK